MDFVFCLPIIVGCPTKIKPDGDQSPRICPRCHNAAMFAAKSRMWFEFFFIPLIPLKSNHVWMCGICQLQAAMQPGWEPPIANPGYQHPGQHNVGSPMRTAPNESGYQPAYLVQK